jgi:hypothetical protein
MTEVTEVKPKRVQLKRAKGWKMPPNTVKVTRPGKWGNPYKFDAYLPAHDATGEPIEHMNAAEERAAVRRAKRRAVECSVSAFRNWINGLVLIGARDLSELRGKNLACFCALDQPCHADVLLEIANA